MSEGTLRQLLHARVQSPLAKILTSIVFSICQQAMDAKLPHAKIELEAVKTDPGVCIAGLMELKGIQRATAVVADDAGIELSYWAMPNETQEQTEAPQVLGIQP